MILTNKMPWIKFPPDKDNLLGFTLEPFIRNDWITRSDKTPSDEKD